jgi:hypothetical protein
MSPLTIVALILVYWIGVVGAYVTRARQSIRNAPMATDASDGTLTLTGAIHITRAAAVLLGPPALLLLVSWLL